MANDSQTVRRTVQFKFTLPSANSGQLASLMKSAAPFYEAFGARRMRLLQNVDDPARFVHEILDADVALAVSWLRRNRRVSGDRVAALVSKSGRPRESGIQRLPPLFPLARE